MCVHENDEQMNISQYFTLIIGSDASKRYRKLLEQWSRVYEELRSHYGSSIDRVKPYFEAPRQVGPDLPHVSYSYCFFSFLFQIDT